MKLPRDVEDVRAPDFLTISAGVYCAIAKDLKLVASCLHLMFGLVWWAIDYYLLCTISARNSSSADCSVMFFSRSG